MRPRSGCRRRPWKCSGGGASPEGSGRIVFASTRDGNYEVYLTTITAFDLRPSWLPDGNKLAFVSLRDGNAELYVMGANGSHPTRVTNDPATDTQPSWQRHPHPHHPHRQP